MFLGRGFSLLNGAVVAGIFLLFVVFIAGKACTGITGADKEAATTAAQEFASNFGNDVTGVGCVNTDSDGDGYVSCTVFFKNQRPLAIECASAMTFNSGCRVAQPGLQLK